MKLQPNIWCVAKARYLFDVAVERAWDDEHGGLAYSFAPNGAPCDWDKIFWVHCESIGTAAMLATVTGLQGGAHNGLGKGFGGLLGGITIETTKSTHRAFWLFGVVCAAISLVYIILISALALKRRREGGGGGGANSRIQRTSSSNAMEKKDEEDENNTFLEDDFN